MTARYRVIGNNGSPYSMKLRAIMRYRRLPFDWVYRTQDVRDSLAGKIKVGLIPVLHVPDEERYLIDSTPIAYELEQRHADRSILPPDPALAFLCHLIEDLADEWLTKAMFLYRWELPVDQEYSARWIICDSRPDLEGDAFEEAVKAIRDRQVSRMALVGCTAENAPVIKESYWKLADALNGFLRVNRYLFGSRPSLADFGLFGQLRTLATDQSPMMEMRERAVYLEHWIRQADDLSGVEGEWIAGADELSAAARALLSIAGEVYLPFLQANADAAAAGNDWFEMELLGKPYAQAPFGYQVKCLQWLREEFGALSSSGKASIEPVMRETGCWDHFAGN